MIRCVAIDDEPLALKQLVSYIGNVQFLELAGSFQSSVEAQKFLNSNQVDVMFVDVNMPDLSGLDLVRSLPNPPLVVLTTAYSEYAVEGYKVEAIGYLLKPFSLNDFRQVAEKVQKQWNLLHAESMVSNADSDNALFFKTDYKVLRVEIPSILYVESMSEYLKIWVDGKKEAIVVLLSLKKLEERLPSGYFMRIHRSYIINLKKIKSVTKGHVQLGDDVTLPIGDLYKESLSAYIDSKFLGK